MIRGSILNEALLTALAVMGHSDILLVVDAGFPIPETGCRRVDLAVTPGVPDIETVLNLVAANMIYEECYVGDEQKEYYPSLYKKVCGIIKRCPVKTIPHDEIMFGYAKKAKVIVRTGAFDPWGNIVLVSGVDAPKWFSKEGIVVPDYYRERVALKE